LEYAEDPAFTEQTAKVYGEAGQTEKAAFYLKRSFSLSPSFEKAHYLFVFYLMMDQPQASLPFLDYAIAHNKGMKLDGVKPLVERTIQLEKELGQDTANVALRNEIAATYLKMDNREGALKYIREVLLSEPGNRDALGMNKKLN
jgi:tetratricopeptide (TPR) repeat protein